MFKKLFIALMVVLMLVSVSSARIIDDVELPETLTAGDKVLLLNGGGTRVAFMNDVYVAGLWLEKPMTDSAEIINADAPMAIRMHVTNDFFASSKNITRALNNGFRNSVPRGDLTPIQEEVDRLKATFADEILDDQEFDIIYIPGEGTSVIKDGKLMDTIPGYEFKKSVWSIWLHETRPADEDLKEGMLEGSISAEALAEKEQWIAKINIEKEAAMATAKGAEEAALKAEAAATSAAAIAVVSEEAKVPAAATEAAVVADASAVEAVAAAEVAKEATAQVIAKTEKQAVTEKDAEVVVAAVESEAVAKKAAEKAVVAAAEAEVAAVKAISKDAFTKNDVYFGVNSTALSTDARIKLAAKANWLKSHPIVSVAVEVYCDSRGSKEYNMKLAKKRAKSVMNYMVDAGIDSSRLELVIKGAIDSAADENAWANNRRAHFKIK